MTNGSRAIFVTPEYQSLALSTVLKVRTIPIGPSIHPCSDIPFKVPNLLLLTVAALSQDGTQICWLVLTTRDKDSGQEIRKLAATIWVTSANGQHPRAVISFPVPDGGESLYSHQRRPINFPDDVQWVPGGRAVSVNWNGRIETVDIPRFDVTTIKPGPVTREER